MGAVGLLTLVLLALNITRMVNARRNRLRSRGTRPMIADRDRLRASAEEFLNHQENRNTRHHHYLDQLIERKAFSGPGFWKISKRRAAASPPDVD